MTDPPRRVNFMEGVLLTAADLASEQHYHREMRYLHNRLHGYGVASGLEVTVTKGHVRVAPGTGIDVQGREIIVTAPLTMRLGPHRNTQPWVRHLVIAWSEVPDGPVPGPNGAVEYTRWVEQPELILVPRDEPTPEGLVLAHLTRTSRATVDVDTSVRRPLAPA
jgi:hypothetical protein